MKHFLYHKCGNIEIDSLITKTLKDELGLSVTSTNGEIALECEILLVEQAVLTTRPELLNQIAPSITLVCFYASEANNKAINDERIDALIDISTIEKANWDISIAQALKVRKRTLSDISERLMYENTIASLDAGIWDWKIVNGVPEEWWSPKVYEIIGYENQEIPATLENFQKIIHEGDQAAWNAEKERFIKERNRFEIKARAIKKDGSIIWVKASGHGFFSPEGLPIRMSGSFIDITSEQRANQDLKVNEALLKVAQNVASTGTFTYNFENKAFWCSNTLKKLLNLKNEKGFKTLTENVKKEDLKGLEFAIEKTLNGIESKEVFFRKQIDNKEYRHFQLNTKLLIENDLIIGTIQDITHFVKVETKFLRQEQMNKEVLDSFPIEIAIYNPDYTYQFVNKKALSSPVARRAIIGLTDKDFFKKPIDKDLAENRMFKLEEAVKSRTNIFWTEFDNKKDSQKVKIRAAYPIYQKNELNRIVSSSMDISKEFAIEQSLKFRIQFEKLIIELSNKLINVDVHEIDDVLNNGLERIGELINVDRVYIFQYQDDKSLMDCTHEWCRNGVEAYIHELKNLSTNSFTHLSPVLQEGSIYRLDDIEELPSDALIEKKEFEKEGIKSILIAPIIRNYRIIGFIGFDMVQRFRVWDKEYENFITLTSQVISNAFERAQSLEAIIDSEEKFRTLTEKAHAAIFITKSGRFVYANPETANITGFELDEIYTKNLADILGENELSSFEESIESMMSNQVLNLRNERQIVTKNGEVRYIDVTSNKINYNGEDSIISIAIDATDKHKKEEERNELINRLTHQNQDLEQFSYIISHNLRSPVAGIKGLISLVDIDGQNGMVNDGIISRLKDSAYKLDKVIQDLNEIISVKQAGVLRKQKVVFKELFQEFKLSHENMILEADADIEADFSAAESTNSVKAYLNSILSNLLTNAIKYRRPNFDCKIEVKTKRRAKHIELIVKDNGSGIDLNKHGKKLFRFKQRFNLSVEGQGMGLYLVKTQTEAIGGTIEVESKVNVGSSFIVKIPA